MSMSSGKGGFTEINITPFVDVMLVLLIIFMVTTPMIQQGETIDLPKTDSSLINDDNDDSHVTLSIDRLKMISIDGEKVDIKTLENTLQTNKVLQEKKEIFLEADREIPYGFVIKIISKIRNSGIPKVNLITEAED